MAKERNIGMAHLAFRQISADFRRLMQLVRRRRRHRGQRSTRASSPLQMMIANNVGVSVGPHGMCSWPNEVINKPTQFLTTSWVPGRALGGSHEANTSATWAPPATYNAHLSRAEPKHRRPEAKLIHISAKLSWPPPTFTPTRSLVPTNR